MAIARPGPNRIVISVNSSWNIVNFRSGLVAALRSVGYEVVVLAPRDEYTPRITEMGCRFVPIAIDPNGINPMTDAALFTAYLKRLRDIRPNIYLGYTIKPNIYGSLAAHGLGIPVINNITGLGAAFSGNGALWWVADILYRLALARSHRVFFQNGDDRALFIDRSIVRLEQAELLPGSGVNLTKFHPDAAPPAAHCPEFRFLLIGRLLWEKGVGEFVEAARTLKAEHHRIICTLLGFVDVKSPAMVDRTVIEGWVREGVVEYLGVTDDVRPAIAAADCVVLPSYYPEGTPRTLIEAAAMATPLIAADAPGCRDVVEHGVNGLLCSIRDSGHLAMRMREMLSLSPQMRKQMGRAGRLKMEQGFDERIVIHRYAEAIHSALSQSRNK
ncbi:glycosyltransferase family 4 protein [Methylocapsa acidiphila]|uniref:glycosyltransferase family 4 protein n=1 Tax=Methylocapsa acidiphila TaxID=133552 RepID=UPI0004790FE0|nr:glycosyltransferase family 4 protein [Methylocapsa acidiphila]